MRTRYLPLALVSAAVILFIFVASALRVPSQSSVYTVTFHSDPSAKFKASLGSKYSALPLDKAVDSYTSDVAKAGSQSFEEAINKVLIDAAVEADAALTLASKLTKLLDSLEYYGINTTEMRANLTAARERLLQLTMFTETMGFSDKYSLYLYYLFGFQKDLALVKDAETRVYKVIMMTELFVQARITIAKAKILQQQTGYSGLGIPAEQAEAELNQAIAQALENPQYAYTVASKYANMLVG